jgi:hypothetical protein
MKAKTKFSNLEQSLESFAIKFRGFAANFTGNGLSFSPKSNSIRIDCFYN